MKKIFLAILLSMIPTIAFAGFGNVWQSSYTTTIDTTKSLCADVGTAKRKGTLHSVCVEDGATTGTISVFNAYSTGVNPVAVIRSSSAIGNCMIFDVNMSSGIVYTNSSGNGVTFTYLCD